VSTVYTVGKTDHLCFVLARVNLGEIIWLEGIGVCITYIGLKAVWLDRSRYKDGL
jgi:hypothetical protein